MDADLASTFQQYLLNFVRTGDPNDGGEDRGGGGGDNLPRFEEYGSESECHTWTLNVKSRESGGLGGIENPGANERCWKWQMNL